MLRRSILCVFVSLAAITATSITTLAQPVSSGQATAEVRIAAILPLTGDMAVHGTEIRQAMELALKDAAPGKFHFRLLFEDNRLDPATSVTAAKKLLDIEKADVIITLWPPAAEVVAPLTERAGVLHYTIAWDPSLAKRFRLLLSHQVMVNDVAASTLQLLKDKGINRVAFFHLEEAGFNLGAQHFEQLAQSFGMTIVSNGSFSGDTTDFHSLIDRTMTGTPDSYVIWSVAPSLDLLIKQLRERRTTAYVTGYLDYAQQLASLEGTEYISEMYASEPFEKAYRAAYGTAPVSKGANAYDIVQLLLSAYGSFPEKPAAADLKAALTKVRDYHGAVGNVSIDADGNSHYSPVRRRISRGSRELVGGAR